MTAARATRITSHPAARGLVLDKQAIRLPTLFIFYSRVLFAVGRASHAHYSASTLTPACIASLDQKRVQTPGLCLFIHFFYNIIPVPTLW